MVKEFQPKRRAGRQAGAPHLQIPLDNLLGSGVGVLVEALVQEAELRPRQPPAQDEHELWGCGCVRGGIKGWGWTEKRM